jgi:hypothetical protein
MEDGAEWRKARAARKAIMKPHSRTAILKRFFMSKALFSKVRMENPGKLEKRQNKIIFMPTKKAVI